jgi:predicted  nucleic acid-binding Zn-ribbon protein
MATSKHVRQLQLLFLAAITLAFLIRSELYPGAPTTTKMKEVTAEVVSTVDTVHYHWHPQQFTNIVKDCIFDDDCGILYHHVFKTGGTTMEKIFFKMLPPSIRDANFTAYELMRTDPKRIPQFSKHPRAYCVQAKFTSYQSSGEKFKEIVKTCLDISKTKRYVTLSTYREPISRTISFIHQHCNKIFDKRSEKLQNACLRCRYNDKNVTEDESRDDKEVWDGYTNQTNNAYDELLHFNKHLKEELIGNKKSRSVDVLMMDMEDLDKFFRGLDEVLVSSQPKLSKNKLRVPFKKEGEHSNKEKLEVCSFGMKSQMIKSLKPSLEAYRKLTLSL